MYTDVPDVFQPGAVVHIEGGGTLTVSSARPHRGHLIVAFEEITDRTTAETMRNVEFSVEADARPALDDDEYWVSDLTGLEVRDRAGSRLGFVADVITAEAQDRLVVDTGDGRVEVPFVPELVPEVLESHLVIDPPAGLFD